MAEPYDVQQPLLPPGQQLQPISSGTKASDVFHLNFGQLAAIVLASWVHFCVVCILFGLTYHYHPVTVWVCISIGVLFNIWKLLRARPYKDYFATTYLLALIISSTVGFFTYDLCLHSYWESRDLLISTNVLPSEDAGGFTDVGEIIFADEARLDFSKALGYKDGAVYCVVPIRDNGADGQKVQFWAVGVDCCSARGAFTCDDAFDPKAKAGIVLRNLGTMNSKWHPQYQDAVKQAEAAFELVSAKTPVYVQWVASPEEVAGNSGRTGAGILTVACCIWLFGGATIAIVLSQLKKGQIYGRDRY